MLPCTIEIHAEYIPALHRLQSGQEIVILTWLHYSRRDSYRCRPRNDPARPIHGVFATRAPHRPNPIGVHQVRILKLQDNHLVVHPLEAVHNTPVIDIKPVLSQDQDLQTYALLSDNEIQEFLKVARQGWERGLFSGANGNLSLREKDRVLITRSGCSKADISFQDLCVLEMESKELLTGPRPSIETGMHLEIYRMQNRARAVVHTHPTHLLALESASSEALFTHLEAYEARVLQSQLGRVAALEPGSAELARAVADKAREYNCILMPRHGLTCWGADPAEALGKSEELESLAQVEINLRLLAGRTS